VLTAETIHTRSVQVKPSLYFTKLQALFCTIWHILPNMVHSFPDMRRYYRAASFFTFCEWERSLSDERRDVVCHPAWVGAAPTMPRAPWHPRLTQSGTEALQLAAHPERVHRPALS
jgi:hypothetical protein